MKWIYISFFCVLFVASLWGNGKKNIRLTLNEAIILAQLQSVDVAVFANSDKCAIT
ncbi:MAG: hypothetical protein PHG27_12245 [Massilibacteroides sp.]|nr:hypothetical protein [Massilibacteroides sp.]MDD3064008.1 hypothetical protein [Massilibacteroides sp.]MDD4116337.1 hypothetical protein [Massilibacteroides sp.]MDD4659593.1 hypothetical protein [Massilibacteroides sp.]